MIYKGFIDLTLHLEKIIHRIVSYDRMNIAVNAATLCDGYAHSEDLTIIALTIALNS